MYWNTVNDLLRDSLNLFMNVSEFSEFRLVGGTCLSLQIGHRESVDIDLFTDSAYGSVNFDLIDSFLRRNFNYVDTLSEFHPGMGRSYFVGSTSMNSIKLDLYYTDRFFQPSVIEDNIRMASIEEIIAMKMDVISRGGRKKDFWDIDELLSNYSIEEMIALHARRYPYSHNRLEIITNLSDFTNADDDFNPICLRGKIWEIIKLNMIEALQAIH